MSQHHTTIRDLSGNPALEALELRDFNAADLAPNVQDDDAFANDEMTEAEIDALYVAEMERRDREAAAAFCGAPEDDDDPTPPARGGLPRGTIMRDAFASYPDDLLALAVDLIDRGRVQNVTESQRLELLAAATAEVLRRLDGPARRAA